MTTGSAPLLDLLLELQRRNFPLGISDYILALKALAGEIDVTSRDDFVFMCSVLWGKSREEQQQVAEALSSLLPSKFTHHDLLELNARSEPVEPEPPIDFAPGSPEQPKATPTPSASDRGGLDPHQLASPAGGAQDATEYLERSVSSIASSITGPGLQIEPLERAWDINPKLDLIGSLPITKRHMKRAWRYFRRMRRVGVPVELDVQATVEHMYRQGVFLRPVLIPRRLNLARLLILADEGGSMIPFRRIVEPLLESVVHSGLAKASVYFFHDAINQRVFEDPWFKKPVMLEKALESFRGAGVLIISDAGSARGNYDGHRLEQTRRFIEPIKAVTSNIAWLNPTPQSRWPGTTAEAICNTCAISMSTLDRAGLYSAVDVIRGRAR